MTKPANKPSPFNLLPDDLVVHILNKVNDLKSLCLCKAACRRFSTLVHEVHTVSFTAPSDFKLPINPYYKDGSVKSKYFRSAIRSMKKFSSLKSVSMELSPSIYRGDNNINRVMFKWKIKISNKFESYVFLSPNSVFNSKGILLHHDNEFKWKKMWLACECLGDAMGRYNMLVECVKDIPSLEKVYIRDWSKRGMVSVSVGGTGKLNNLLPLGSPWKGVNYVMRRCCIPVLELPVSGCVMKEVTLVVFEIGVNHPIDTYHSLLNYDEGVEFDDEDEAAYVKEAVMEIFKKHRDEITSTEGVI
ncbi:F-box protein AUF2-like [Bidens hawaiensis]|uniref:F-box protein AUF2-like n=1 Tax=Bidens hawaiensis TaxID=980011 RepID=UPI004049162B